MAADLDKPTLHHGHRCDSCGSRAYVHVILETNVDDNGYVGTGQLFFCAHHANEHMPVMRLRSNIVHYIDETRFLAVHVKDDGWVEGKK